MRLQQAVLRFVAITCLVTFGLAGCSSGKKDFSEDDFKTMKPGMSEEKVREVVGKPSDDMEAMGTRRLFWETKGKYYSISFKGGKVIEPLVHADKQDYMLMKGLMDAAKDLKLPSG